jgi:hypothetical protein
MVRLAVLSITYLLLSISFPMQFSVLIPAPETQKSDCLSDASSLEDLRKCMDTLYRGDSASPEYACRYMLSTWSETEAVRVRLGNGYGLLTIPYLQDSYCRSLYPDGYYISTIDEAVSLANSLYGEVPPLFLNPYRLDSYRDTISYFLGEIPYTTPTGIEARTISEEIFSDHIRRKIEYQSSIDDWVSAYLLMPLNLENARPAVLALHETVAQGKDEPVGIEGHPDMAYGLELVRRGYIVLAPDTITAGERVQSGETPYDTATFDATYPNWSAMGKMLWDHKRALDYLQSLPEVDPDAIGVIGHSLGGYMFLAAFDNRIKATVASSAYTRMEADPNREGWARAGGFVHFPRMRPYLLDSYSGHLPWDFQHLMTLIAPRPVWQSFGLSDEIFVNGLSTTQIHQVVLPFYERFGTEDRLRTNITNGPHGFPGFLRQNAYAFLDTQLLSANPYSPETDYWYGEFTRLEAAYRQTWQQNLVRFEESAYPQGDGALIGWVDGSYALPAYLDMYDWGKDRLYLDRFVVRAKQLLTYLWDANGDGMAGWPTSRYSTNYINNGGFEANTTQWNGMSESENLVRSADGGPGYLFDISGIGCDEVLAGAFHGEWNLALDATSVVTQSIAQLPSRSLYGLRMDVKIPAGLQLAVELYEPDDDSQTAVLSRQISTSELRGPQGWQQFSTVVEVNSSSTITFVLRSIGTQTESDKIIVDNVVLSPFEEYLAEEMTMAGVLARFAAVVGANAELGEYATLAESFSTVAEKTINKWQPYWHWVDEERGAYIAPDDDSLPGFQGRSLPYNMMSLAGTAHLWLSQSPYAENPTIHSKYALALARTLQHAIRVNPEYAGSLIWNYSDPILPADPQTPGGIEDISHAGPSAAFIGQLIRSGHVFTETEGTGIAQTFSQVVWNGNQAQPLFSRFLDGGGGPIPLTLGMPYYRHMEVSNSHELRSAVSSAWNHAQTYLGCHVQHRTSLTGRNLSVPALMLLTKPVDTSRYFLPLVTQ